MTNTTINTNTAKANTAAVIDVEAVKAAAAAKVTAAEVKAAKANTAAAEAVKAAKAEAAAEVKAAKALRNKKGEELVKLRHNIEAAAEGVEALHMACDKALNRAKAIKPEEVTRPEAITAAAEAIKTVIDTAAKAKAKAAEALRIEVGEDRTKKAKLTNLLTEAEALAKEAEAAAAIVKAAEEEAKRPLTKSEINDEKRKAITEALEASGGNTSREAFWKLFIDCKFAVKPTKANYLAAFGKEGGSTYYTDINKLFDKFLDNLLDLRRTFGNAEAYAEAETEAYKSFKDICNKLHLVNLDNCGVSDTLMHTLAARGYNWRIIYDEKKEAHIIAAAKSNNAIMFEIFAEITSPEAIAAAIAKREAKKADRIAKAKAKAAKKAKNAK